MGYTPAPWSLCAHLIYEDRCSCGYRGVIWGPDSKAVCQPGHEPAPEGQEGTEPERYTRETEYANARLISAAPDLLKALELFVEEYVELVESGDAGYWNAENENKVKLSRAAISKAKGEVR